VFYTDEWPRAASSIDTFCRTNDMCLDLKKSYLIVIVRDAHLILSLPVVSAQKIDSDAGGLSTPDSELVTCEVFELCDRCAVFTEPKAWQAAPWPPSPAQKKVKRSASERTLMVRTG
jgi:hypothetical protein